MSELTAGQNLWAVAVEAPSVLEMLTNKGRAKKIISAYPKLVNCAGVHPQCEKNALIYLFHARASAASGLNILMHEGLKCDRRLMKFKVASDGVPEFVEMEEKPIEIKP